MKEKLTNLISNRRIIYMIYFILTMASSIQALVGTVPQNERKSNYTEYNNYIIFQQSFEHLKNHQDLYTAYPEEHWDLYKYTPSFAVFFSIFSVLPTWLGLSLWNLLNVLILIIAIYYLPKLSNLEKGLILLLMLFEFMTSIQNEQSNALIAGLLVLSFGLLEKDKSFLAALCIVFSVFVKLFGIVGLVLFLFYPKKWKSALYVLFWTCFLMVLPLLFLDFNEYTLLFKSYMNLLSSDHDSSYGYSVMGWIHSWFSIEINKGMIVGIGVLLFLLPLVKFNLYQQLTFKQLMLNSVLIWIVIFNHRAESPTFIIAMTGVALWYMQSEKNKFNLALFMFAFVFTSVSSTDLFPRYFKVELVEPYMLKTFPCIIIWLKIIYDAISLKADKNLPEQLADNASAN